MRFFERIGMHRPELRAWAAYDWANSGVQTTVIAAVFPPYFYAIAADAPGDAGVTFKLATSIAVIAIGLISPLLGAIADFAAVKKRMLASFMTLGALSVAGLFFVQRGDWLAGIILFMFANVGLAGSFVFYDALLPHIARNDELDRVSTTSWGLGYLGGGILLALNLAWITKPELFGMQPGDFPVRLALLSAAFWWVIFAIPLFRRVPEPPRLLERDEHASTRPIRAAFVRLGETFRELRGYRHAFLMLLAFLIYSDGIGTIVRVATMYGSEIGIDRDAMILALLITQFVGVPCAFLFGSLAIRIGAKACIMIGLAGYVGITMLGYFMTSATHFLALAVLVGIVQGGTQALSRSLFARLIPRHKSGEFFGFYGVMDRFSGSIGTLVMGLIQAATGSPRTGILVVIVFFVVGAGLLLFVDVSEGEAAARSAEQAAGLTAE